MKEKSPRPISETSEIKMDLSTASEQPVALTVAEQFAGRYVTF